MNLLLKDARRLLIIERQGVKLSPFQKATVAQAMETFGPETVYMDGELFAGEDFSGI